MKKYQAVPGMRINDVQAQKYGEAIDRLREDLGHDPCTDEIVEAARSPQSPFHDYFTWDQKKAAAVYLKVQARELMRSICEVMIYRDKEVPVRSFFSVRSHPEEPRAYATTASIEKNPYARQQLIEYALKEAEMWRRKYRIYQEFHLVHVAIKETRRKVKKIRV